MSPAIFERGVLVAVLTMLAGVLLLHTSLFGVLLALPLAACLPGVTARRGRSYVLAGAIALPYLCFAIVELLASSGRSPGALLLFAGGVGLMIVLAPATRLAGRRS